MRRIKWVSFLDMMPFNKFDALTELSKNYRYTPYPYKHYESIFTRLYQGYILPNKFGIDKRRLHLSTLVVSGQMTRAQAMTGLEGIAYGSESELEADKQYFMERMGWTQEDLTQYMSRGEKPHGSYGTEKPIWNAFERTYSLMVRRSD